MYLIPVTITVLKNESSIGQKDIKDEVDLTFEIEVRGSGDFSEFVVDGKIDSEKITLALLEGEIKISKYVE